LFKTRSNEKLLKYEQIVTDVKESIRQKIFCSGDDLPSITKVSREYGVARETVVKAYGILKGEGVIESRAGKGFHIASESLDFRPRVFLMLNTLNPYMEVLYNAFLKLVENEAIVDVFFHHSNAKLFEDLVTSNLGKYYSYIIKPFDHPAVEAVLSRIDKADLLILDRRDFIVAGNSYICQDFDHDFYSSLCAGLNRMQQYEKIILVFPPEASHTPGAIETFNRFCADHALTHDVITKVSEIAGNSVYITILDDDLVQILKLCRNHGYKIGRDIGILSYNDYPMKEFVAGGITVVSADFTALGRDAAEFALYKKPVRKLEYAKIIWRASL